MATNRADTLDPALLRPGRLDRKIEFPQPSRREKRLIFQTITSKMNLGPDLDLEDCEYFMGQFLFTYIKFAVVSRPDKISSAEIASICQAAGLQGLSCDYVHRSGAKWSNQRYGRIDMLFSRPTWKRRGRCGQLFDSLSPSPN